MIFTFYSLDNDILYDIQYIIWTTVFLIQNVYLNTITCHKNACFQFQLKNTLFLTSTDEIVSS